jgi:hypothetical protein
MAGIDRQHRIAEGERGGTDQEIGKGDHDTAALESRISPTQAG